MNDDIERKVRAAAVAGWWVVLAAFGVLLLSWVAYLVIIPARPELLLSLCGPDLSWEFIRNVWFWALVMFKLSVWLMVLFVLWLTLWARQLRRH